MKRILLCFLGQLLFVGCGSSTLPKVDDVCSVMDDISFMRYCYANFDVNEDGKVSMTEANAVNSIDCTIIAEKLVSLKGIEYFTNLTSIYCEECENLIFVDLSKNEKITKIQDDAFSGCYELETIILPKSLESIGEGAFGFTNLKSIDIPNNVKRIGEGAFYECEIKEFKGKFASSDGCCLLDNETLVALRTKRDIVTYRLPEDVKYIRNQSIDTYSVIGLNELVIPKSVESVVDRAFEKTKYLNSIKFECPTPPKFISSYAFNEEYVFFPAAFGNDNFKIYVPELSVAEYKNNAALQKFAEFIVGYK